MTGLSLSTIANVAEIVGGGSIFTGMIFGFFQIRQYRAQQRDAIATNLMQTFYSRDLAQAIALLHSLPDGLSEHELRSRGPEYTEAAVTVTTSFETMGLLVFKRIAPLDLVLDLAGGIITAMSRKLARWQEDVRVSQDQPSWGEWFDWLGDRTRQAKHADEPAHLRYRDWKP
jgi:hypothetical protein